MNNVIDLTTKRLEVIQEKLKENAKDQKITSENLDGHLQNVTNSYLKIFSALTREDGVFDVKEAIKVRAIIHKQFMFLLSAMDQEIGNNG